MNKTDKAFKEAAKAAGKLMITAKKQRDRYWETYWKRGAYVLATDGDWSIGWGKIVKFKDKEKLFALIKLERPYHNQMFYTAYKGYCYRPSK